MPKKSSITILCLSRLSLDSRLQRHLKFFAMSGFDIRLVSLIDPQRQMGIDGVQYYDLDLTPEGLWHPPAANETWGDDSQRSPSKLQKAARYAHMAYGRKPRSWLTDFHIRRFVGTAQFRDMAQKLTPTDIVMANDWNTLVMASQLIKDWSAIGLYDSHEHATEEFSDLKDWRMFMRPVIKETERHFIPDFQIVTTVSDSIATALSSLYSLDSTPHVIRNIPQFDPASTAKLAPQTKTPQAMRFLYLGAIAPRRGLQTLVESLAYWRPDQTLTLMGPHHKGPLAQQLSATARSIGASKQFNILPPVPPVDVTQKAQAYDAGLIILPTDIKQNQWAMPNKLFEYMAAGLAIISTPVSDISRLITEQGTGFIVPDGTAQKLGQTIANIRAQALQSAQQKSRSYTATLSWTQDYEPVLTRIKAVMASRQAA